VFPTDGRQVSQGLVINGDAVAPQGSNGAFKIYGVPKNDGGDNQVQAAGAISLVLEAAVAEVALAVEEDGTRESVSGSPLLRPTWTRLRSSGSFIHSNMKRERSIRPISRSAVWRLFWRG
jgi:hypothetical protein